MSATKAIWTRNLTNANSPFTMQSDFGFSKFSITNSSAVGSGLNIQITGSKTVYVDADTPLASQAYVLVPDESFNYAEDETLEDFTITLDVGATAKIIGFN